MKSIFVSLFAISNIFAMELPQSQKDCFFSYTFFKAIIETCKETDRWEAPYRAVSTPNIEERRKCIIEFYKDFIIECKNEVKIRKDQENKNKA